MEQKQLDKMNDLLGMLDVAKNKVSIAEFGEYLPLFSNSHMPEDQATTLASKFIRRFNPYENIHVTSDVDDKEIVTLPRLFTKVNAIDPKLEPLVSRFSRDANSEIPKYAAEATRGLMTAIKLTHENDEYKGYISEISEDYSKINEEWDTRNSNEEEVEEKDTPQVDKEAVDGDILSWE